MSILQRIQAFGGLHWAVLLLVGIMSTLLGVALAIYLAVALTPVLSHPLSAEVVDAGVNGFLCPGDLIHSTVKVTIDGALITDVIWTIAPLEVNTLILGQQVGTIARPPADETELYQEFPWLVPKVLPGKYEGVLSYWVRSGGSRPVFVKIPFEVAETGDVGVPC